MKRKNQPQLKPIEKLTLRECILVLTSDVGISSYFKRVNGEVKLKHYEELTEAQILNLKKVQVGSNSMEFVIETRFMEVVDRYIFLLESTKKPLL